MDDRLITSENPRYVLPGERTRDGKAFGFRKSRFVYNGSRVGGPVDNLVVVEGFPATWWLVQGGFDGTVATMGADCSERQAEIIVSLVRPGDTVWIMPDGDSAGEHLAEQLLVQVSPHRPVRWVKLPQGSQPTDLTVEELKLCFVS